MKTKEKRIPFSTFISSSLMTYTKIPEAFSHAYKELVQAIEEASLIPDIESIKISIGTGPISTIMVVAMDGVIPEVDE